MAVQTQIQTRRGTAATWTSTNPTLAAGEIGFESDTGKIKIGTGSTAWNALAYTASSTAVTYLYNATAAQTTFSGADANGLTLAYTVGSEQVYLNGVLQVRGSDYTATNGTSIVLTSGALVSDVLNVIAFSALALADTYTQAQANALFIPDAIVDAKGDLIAATAADTVGRLAVGANDLVLTADSAEATGLKYTGGWTTWTPTYTAITIGNGTVSARYQKIGKTVNLFWRFVLGSTSVIGTSPNLTLPIASSQSDIIFPVRYLDSGVTNYFGIASMGGGTTVLGFQEMRVNGTYGDIIGNITATVPFTWTTNDSITVQASYEVA